MNPILMFISAVSTTMGTAETYWKIYWKWLNNLEPKPRKKRPPLR
jgi:hypothetical protein